MELKTRNKSAETQTPPDPNLAQPESDIKGDGFLKPAFGITGFPGANKLERSIARPRPTSPADILQLQRTYGNQAVLRLLNKNRPPGDKISPGINQNYTQAGEMSRRHPEVIQRKIKGLEDYTEPWSIPEGWVELYLDDMQNSLAHLYDEEIYAFLNWKDPKWQEEAHIENKGNHWEAILFEGKENQVKVETRHDGNCGVHAIDAVLSRNALKGKEIKNHFASPEAIESVRLFAYKHLTDKPKDIKERIAKEIRECDFVAEAGFGATLTEALQEIERKAYQIQEHQPLPGLNNLAGNTGNLPPDNPGLPSGLLTGKPTSTSTSTSGGSQPPEAKFDPETQELVGRILKIEKTLIEWVQAEENEKKKLENLKENLKKDFLAYKANREKEGTPNAPQTEGEGQNTEIDLESKLKAKRLEFSKIIKKREQEAQERISLAKRLLKELLPKKMKEWEFLMEKLSGTHRGKADKPSLYSKLPSQRHDALPGIYGSKPTEKDQMIGKRQMEVIHGHGAWTRSGLLSRGQANSRMPGLTNLSEIIKKANEIREKSGKPPILPGNVDLAFVGYHGIPSAHGRGYEAQPQLKSGAYPELFDLPQPIIEKVNEMLSSAEAKKLQTPQEVDQWFKRKCQKGNPNQRVPKKYNKSFNREYVWKDKEHSFLYDSFKRIQNNQTMGEAAKYVEILRGDEHGNTFFPDMRLSSLTPPQLQTPVNKKEPTNVSQGHGYDSQLTGLPFPNLKLSMFEDMVDQDWTKKIPEKDSDNEINEGSVQFVTSVKLSNAIATRLAEIENVDQPVRIFWAACRSEILPPEFNDKVFLRWIEEAAAAAKR